MEKFQIPRNKFQTCPPIGVINFGDQIFGMSSATVLFGIWGLRIEVYLGFGICDLIFEFKENPLVSSIRWAAKFVSNG